MGSDDHKLAVIIPCRKFIFKPGSAGRIKKAMPVDAGIAIGFTLRIIQYDNLDRHCRLRHEAVTGKPFFLILVDQVETVTGGI